MKKGHLLFCAILFLSDCIAATYYSQGTAVIVTFITCKDSSDVGGNSPTAFNVASDVFGIQSGQPITTNAKLMAFSTGGKVQTEAGVLLNAPHLFNVLSVFQVDNGGTYNLNAAGSGTDGSATDFSGSTGTLSLSGGPITNLRSFVHAMNLDANMLVSGGTWSVIGVHILPVASGKTLTINSGLNVYTPPIVYCNCIRLIHQTLKS